MNNILILLYQNCVDLFTQNSYSIQNNFQTLVYCQYSCNITCTWAQDAVQEPENCVRCFRSEFPTLFLFLIEFSDFPWAPPWLFPSSTCATSFNKSWNHCTINDLNDLQMQRWKEKAKREGAPFKHILHGDLTSFFAVSQPVSVQWGAWEGHVFQAKCRWSSEMLQLRPGLTHSNANVMLLEAEISEIMSLFSIPLWSFTFYGVT